MGSVWTVNTEYTFTLEDLQSEGLGSYLFVSHWNNNCEIDTSVCSATSSYGSLIILETLNFYVPWHVHCVIRPGTTGTYTAKILLYIGKRICYFDNKCVTRMATIKKTPQFCGLVKKAYQN